MSLRSKLGFGAKAGSTEFTPRSNIPRSDVQGAVEYVMDNAENVGTVYAPTDAQYLTNGAVAGLSNERAVTDTSTITWDFSTLGQAKANWAWMGIEDLTDPNADRIAFWDDSEGAFKWLDAGQGLDFTGTNIHVTDELLDLINLEFVSGDVLYHDGTNLKRLAAGTDGQFLRTRGAGTAPDWQNISGGGDMLRANNLSDLSSAATARTNLGVAIGTNVQAWDAQLDSLSSASANGVSLVTAADYAAMKALLDLEIGTDLQAWSTHIDSIAALARTDGNVIVGNGTTWVAESGNTARTSLGLGTGDSPEFAGVTISGGQGLSIGSSVPFSDAAGTLTLTNIDALDATTETTIETAIDTLANLGSIQGVAFTFGAYAATLLNNANEAAFKQAVNLEIGVDVQAYSSILANTTASFTTTDETKVDYLTVTGATDLDTIRTKVGHITITQAVDLDAIEARVNQLDASVVLSGTWDASAGTFPGGGTAQAGQSYIVSIGGTVDGVAFTANDRIVAILDNASTTTYASNWHKLDYTDAVLSVAGRTGAVTIASTDLTDSTANGRAILTAADYAAMKALLDLEIGTDVQAYSAALASYPDPTANDADALGTGAASWSDLFLASGGVINWNNSDVTITHSANALTFQGADNGYLFSHAAIPQTTDGAALGSTANMWSDLFLASGGVINFNNGDVTITHSANALAIAGGVTALDAASTVGGSLIKTVGAETIWIPAKAMTARTTNGAASGTTESTTNDVVYPTFDFDQSTEEGVGFWIAMPKSWNESTVTFIPYWTAASGSGGVVFAINAYAFSNDDAIDTAPSGQQTSTDTLIATGDIHVGPESSAITIGGTPAEGDIVYFQITREVGDGSDTLSGDAKLIGVKVIFTTNAATDA